MALWIIGYLRNTVPQQYCDNAALFVVLYINGLYLTFGKNSKESKNPFYLYIRLPSKSSCKKSCEAVTSALLVSAFVLNSPYFSGREMLPSLEMCFSSVFIVEF